MNARKILSIYNVSTLITQSEVDERYSCNVPVIYGGILSFRRCHTITRDDDAAFSRYKSRCGNPHSISALIKSQLCESKAKTVVKNVAKSN